VSDASSIGALYESFNARDVDAVLAAMTTDVRWPNAWEGGVVRGHEEVRDYWRRQWAEIDPRVDPVAIDERPDGTRAVRVRQVVHDMEGNVIADHEVLHVYRYEGGLIAEMTIEETPVPAPAVVTGAELLWFLGTLVRILLDGAATDGRFALIELTLPLGAAPPMHKHPQDETFYVLDGELTMFVGDSRETCRAGATVYTPGGSPHGWRVESDTARMLILSTPAGLEEYFRALAQPAAYPWLQPPPDGPRVPAERIAEVERSHGVIRLGPLPE